LTSQATRPATINPKYDYCEEKEDQRALIHVCATGAHHVWCAVCEKKRVNWEVEVAWRRCKVVVVVVVVVITMKPSFTEALRAFESMRAFMYAHITTKRDQANIVNIESLLLKLKRKGATKQMKINDFLKKK
jgi:hypothetical protein